MQLVRRVADAGSRSLLPKCGGNMPRFNNAASRSSSTLLNNHRAQSYVSIPSSSYKPSLTDLYEYAKKRPTGVSLRTLMDFGSPVSKPKLLQAAKWLHNEMPIRLAGQVQALDRLPYGLCLMPSVRKVREWYVQSFGELRAMPRLQTDADEHAFTELLQAIYRRHSPTLQTMAKGVYELKQELTHLMALQPGASADLSEYVELHHSLDRFYMARIAIRMLIGQHLELHAQVAQAQLHQQTPERRYVGLICRDTPVAEVARDALQDARDMCARSYGELHVPAVEVLGRLDLAFPYVPSHLYYMLFELLKNSLRAVAEHHLHQHQSSPALPAVKLVIAGGADTNEDVCIKIADEGGGIPRSQLSKLWSYLYTTAPLPAHELLADSQPDFDKQAPLAGLGVGLPLSRLYARYFGGDLQLLSMEGYGTDAYLHLARLGDREEPLP